MIELLEKKAAMLEIICRRAGFGLRVAGAAT
jgi:hypothetical protein